MSTVAMRMRRGWFRDPEDHHGTYRMSGALGILKGYGAEPKHREHDESCGRHPVQLRNVVHGYRGRVVCSCGADHANVEWPEWVTDECFEAAYRAADVLQTARGSWHQREASRKHSERERERLAREMPLLYRRKVEEYAAQEREARSRGDAEGAAEAARVREGYEKSLVEADARLAALEADMVKS